MKWLISEVNVCDYGDGEAGSCLADKTDNSPEDAEDHVFTRCNGCGRMHNCAVIAIPRLRLKDGVQFASGMVPKQKKPQALKKRAALKKPIPKKK